MQEPNTDETQPTDLGDTQISKINTDETQEVQVAPKPKKFPWIKTIVLGWMFLVVIVAIGGYGGYRAGTNEVAQTATATHIVAMSSQLVLARADFEARNFDLALLRLDWIITNDPTFAEAINLKADVLFAQRATTTPTPAIIVETPTPSFSPTPDLRDEETLFQEAEAYMALGEWGNAISTLSNLRKNDVNYRAVDIDSMLYVAYRNRGVDKLLKTGELEGGLFDFSQAELFGPLDSEAEGYAVLARFYIIGASFWEIDWGQSAFYFGQVAPYLPNMQDGNGWFALDRFNTAVDEYIMQLELAFETQAANRCDLARNFTVIMEMVNDPRLDSLLPKYNSKCLGIDD